jgi:AbrB family looped-hinge helix DNA binding protein
MADADHRATLVLDARLPEYRARANREAVVETGSSLTSKVGKRGAVVIPAPLRRRFGIEEGTLVVAEATDEGVLIRPAVAVPVEVYSPERKARLLLENAVDASDYARAAAVVREELALDPDLLGTEPPQHP